ncbi:MAG: DUF1828 domain-containing protein [Chloroflexi bacterium]|nr:DUF1828 domain-containing protein [Chloroflexota bacterium]
MIEQITKLTEEYHIWVGENTTLREIANCVEITTPFLDRHNDMMQIFATVSGNEIILSDDGYTIEDLEFCGVNVNTSSRRRFIEQNLNGFGVKRKGNDLVARATAEDFALSMHNLLQAMIAIDDLYYLATPSKVSRFDADLVTWLNDAGIRFDAKKFKGRTGYNVDYKYVIPPSDKMPERMLLAIDNPDRSAVEQVAFRWLDIRDERPSDARLYPILNDAQHGSVLNEMDAFRNLEIKPVLWTSRHEVLPELAA